MYKMYAVWYIPAVEHVDSTEARKTFSALCRRAGHGKERIVIDFHGKPIAALVPIEDFDHLERTASTSRERPAPQLSDYLTILRRAEPELKAAGVRHASIFGSVSRGEARADSDVDILVELDPSARVGLVAFVSLRDRLGELMNRRVDLVSVGSLDRDRAATILRDRKTAF